MTNKPDRDPAQRNLVQVLERFPKDASLIRRLWLANESFRTICEDYVLARDSLARFQAMPDAQQRPEIADYLSVIAGLEDEIAALLRSADGSMKDPGP